MYHRYPRRLIPKHGFAPIKDSIIRDSMKDFFLLRLIKRDDQKMVDFREELKNQFIPSTFKNGISVVLLSVFQRVDSGWSCRKPFGKVRGYESKWSKNQRQSIPKNKHLRYNKKTTFGGYKVDDVLAYDLEFITTVKDDEGKKKRDKHGNEIKRKDHLRLKVIHDPICINFWHFDIVLCLINGDDLISEVVLTNKEIERAGNLILDDLAGMAYPAEETKKYNLPKKYYTYL